MIAKNLTVTINGLRCLLTVLLLFAQLFVGFHWAEHFTPVGGAIVASGVGEETPYGDEDGADCVICHFATNAPIVVAMINASHSFAYTFYRPSYPSVPTAAATASPASFRSRAPPVLPLHKAT
jgi:hypothetical protein